MYYCKGSEVCPSWTPRDDGSAFKYFTIPEDYEEAP
jgi:hypothetical protein